MFYFFSLSRSLSLCVCVCLLRVTTRILTFGRLSFRIFAFGLSAQEEMSFAILKRHRLLPQVPEMMYLVMRHCVSPLEVSVSGLLRRPDPEPVASRRSETRETVRKAMQTSVEDAEDVIYEMCLKREGSQQLGQVSQKVQERRANQANQKFGKAWYEQHILSFDLEKASCTSGSKGIERSFCEVKTDGNTEYRVKLTPTGRKHAELRWIEAQREDERSTQLSTLEEILKMLKTDQVPQTLREAELCGLIILAEDRKLVANALKRLLERSNGDPIGAAELLPSISPFTTAQIMQAIVRHHKDKELGLKYVARERGTGGQMLQEALF